MSSEELSAKRRECWNCSERYSLRGGGEDQDQRNDMNLTQVPCTKNRMIIASTGKIGEDQ